MPTVLIGRLCHMFMCCRQIRDARHDARALPAAGRFDLVAGDVLLLRFDADAVCRLHGWWVVSLMLMLLVCLGKCYFGCIFSVIATVALAFLLLPMCQYIIRPCTDGNRISFGMCGRYTSAELLSFSLALSIVCVWVLTGHWLLMDGMYCIHYLHTTQIQSNTIFFSLAMGMGLCVAFIAFVRLPSLKVSTLLLTGLLLYDVFWVFFSSYIFNTNVMVKVATRPADNPVGMVARKFNLGMAKEAPKLNLPGKLVFPSIHNNGHFSMLGLGDIVMPGLLLCFVLRYDAYKKAQGILADSGVPIPKGMGSRLTYFHCSLLG